MPSNALVRTGDKDSPAPPDNRLTEEDSAQCNERLAGDFCMVVKLTGICHFAARVEAAFSHLFQPTSSQIKALRNTCDYPQNLWIRL
jgi:hypothetical protein